MKVLPLCSVIVCLSLANGLAQTAEPVPLVRVMSFNIRYGTAKDGVNHWDKRKDFLVETIQEFEPDLLGTQETLAFQRDYLSSKLDGYEAFGVGRDNGQDEGEMAALFFRRARFEKVDGGHFWLSETPETIGSKGWDAALPRVATWVKLKDRNTPDKPAIFFLNTHFDHRGQKARAESAKLIRDRLAMLGQGCRVVVTGDFNAGEGTGPYQSLFADLDNKPSPVVDTFRTFVPTRGKEEGTFSGFKAGSTAGERIDWVAASRDWDVRLAGIDRTEREGRTPSDHYPVTAVLRPAQNQPTLRVLCYNIHHGRGTDDVVDLLRLAKVIRAMDPDLVALQEVDDKTTRTNKVDQTAELARLTGMYGQFGKAIDYAGGGYGQSLLSRFPLEEPTIHTLPGEPEREQRIAFQCQVKAYGQDLLFVTTHLHHQAPALRERQAAKLNELYSTKEQLVILAGDINATPESKPVQILLEQWSNATAKAGLFTFPAEKPNKQIDFIFFRPKGRVLALDPWVPNEPVTSDHRPIFVEFQFPKR